MRGCEGSRARSLSPNFFYPGDHAGPSAKRYTIMVVPRKTERATEQSAATRRPTTRLPTRVA